MIPEVQGLRVPPHSAEAERGVLGSVLLDPMPSFGKATGKQLTAEMFYDRRHQALYQSMQEMVVGNVPMDAITIGQWLADRNELDRVGGYDYLVELQDATLVPANVEFYSDIVIEKYQYRSLINLAADLTNDAYTCEDSAHDLLQSVPGRLVKLMKAKKAVSNQEVVDEWFKRMEAIKAGEASSGLPLPWPNLDKMLCGLEPGLIVVGARPSAGKTTFEVNVCDYLARQGCHVARACLDMSREQLLVRSVIRESRVSLPRLKRGWARMNQVETVREVKDLVARWPHHIIEERTLDGICTQARMLKLKYDIQLLTIDFLTLIQIEKSYGNRVNDIGKITSTLKALAFELNIPVMLLSQLNRGSAKDERRPRLEDLRESGDIEQDATQVILISKAMPKEFPHIENLPEDAERRILRGIVVDVAKYQNGETGIIEMWMRPNYFQLFEAEEEFMDIHGRLSEWKKETDEDEVCDPNEPAVCDGDDEVEAD